MGQRTSGLGDASRLAVERARAACGLTRWSRSPEQPWPAGAAESEVPGHTLYPPLPKGDRGDFVARRPGKSPLPLYARGNAQATMSVQVRRHHGGLESIWAPARCIIGAYRPMYTEENASCLYR